MSDKMGPLTEKDIWELLESVKDPEIPVVSVVEMGIVRDVDVDDQSVKVAMTPTFTGCPAIHVMKAEIEACLMKAGAAEVEVRLQNKPPWTSDWITPEAREKLRQFGLAPPPVLGESMEKRQGDAFIDLALIDVAVCPYCGSEDTTLKNSFGPTLCRSIYYCNACQQPFEQFKAL